LTRIEAMDEDSGNLLRHRVEYTYRI